MPLSPCIRQELAVSCSPLHEVRHGIIRIVRRRHVREHRKGCWSSFNALVVAVAGWWNGNFGTSTIPDASFRG
ncbi:hypothetical protein HYQ46_003290 [Verticillium longisporum]|nr:hypothetical protein HYQ46_003290 [Verticillium longisporum]